MAAHITADQSADGGWTISVEGIDSVTVVTSPTGVSVAFTPEDEDEPHGRPLDVALDQPKSDQ